MINSITLSNYGNNPIKPNKAMENPKFAGNSSNAESDKDVNNNDWVKKNATKIGLGATALAGVIAAGILLKGRSRKINNLTDDIREGTTQVINNTLEKFRKEGNIYHRGHAITKDGERYTGELVTTKKDGSNVFLTFENGYLKNSKIVKDGKTLVEKNYEFGSGVEKIEIAGKKYDTAIVQQLSINGKDTKVFHLPLMSLSRDNVKGGLRDASIISPVNGDSAPIPETITLCGNKLRTKAMTLHHYKGNGAPNTLRLSLQYESRDIDNHRNIFRMGTDFDVNGNKTKQLPKDFDIILEKFKKDLGNIQFDKGSFYSSKKDADLFKYNYHTKEISDLNGISKEDAQEIVDFFERHYNAASKKILKCYSHEKYCYGMK